jgi:hypothetical protein
MSGSSNTVKVVMVPYDEYVTLLTNAYKGRKDGRKLTAKQTAKVNDGSCTATSPQRSDRAKPTASELVSRAR